MTARGPAWYESVANLRDLFSWLTAEDADTDDGLCRLETMRDVCYFLEKPWKWEPAWRAYQKALARDLETAQTEPPDEPDNDRNLGLESRNQRYT